MAAGRGWRKGNSGRIFEGMIINALKLVGAAALVVISSGAWPNPRYGAAVALGVCIMAAVILHFAAP